MSPPVDAYNLLILISITQLCPPVFSLLYRYSQLLATKAENEESCEIGDWCFASNSIIIAISLHLYLQNFSIQFKEEDRRSGCCCCCLSCFCVVPLVVVLAFCSSSPRFFGSGLLTFAQHKAETFGCNGRRRTRRSFLVK